MRGRAARTEALERWPELLLLGGDGALGLPVRPWRSRPRTIAPELVAPLEQRDIPALQTLLPSL